jgi:hypothetical protein
MRKQHSFVTAVFTSLLAAAGFRDVYAVTTASETPGELFLVHPCFTTCLATFLVQCLYRALPGQDALHAMAKGSGAAHRRMYFSGRP